MIVKRSIQLIAIAFAMTCNSILAHAWDVDFSRRQNRPATKEQPKVEVAPVAALPATSQIPKDPPPNPQLESLISRAVTKSYDRQEVVILNTAKGFIPNNVRLHRGLHYLVHIVNVNEGKKNISFMLDAFDQHHATYYGQLKSFNLDPDKEGVYQYQCPETSAQGKLVIFGANPKTESQRTLSSDQD